MPRKTKESSILTDKQKKFCQEYCKTLNATASYINVFGGNRETARRNAYLLRQNTDVEAYIARLQSAGSLRSEITQEKVLKELAHIAFSDITDVVEFTNDSITIKNSSQLTRDITASIKKFTITRSSYRGKETVESQIELFDKTKALDKLTSYLGMNSDFNTMLMTARKYGFRLYLDPQGNLRSERIQDAEAIPPTSDTEKSIADRGDSTETGSGSEV